MCQRIHVATARSNIVLCSNAVGALTDSHALACTADADLQSDSGTCQREISADSGILSCACLQQTDPQHR